MRFSILLVGALAVQVSPVQKVIELLDECKAKVAKDLAAEAEVMEEYVTFCDDELKEKGYAIETAKREMGDLSATIEDSKATVMALTNEIAELEGEVSDLTEAMKEATELREKEHEDFVETLAANTAAVDLLKFAKNRLNKFYNPSQYKAPPKRELTEEQQITLNNGGTLAPTDAPGGIAGTGIGFTQSDAAPPPPPEANLAYQKKGEESSGVIRLIDMIINDVDKENQVMELEEKDAQGDYEKFMKDSSDKRAEDSKSMTDKEAALAESEEGLVNDKEALKNKKTDLMNTDKTLSDLHADCDWLLKYYEARKEARTGEIDAMGKAKDVLNGADYSF